MYRSKLLIAQKGNPKFTATPFLWFIDNIFYNRFIKNFRDNNTIVFKKNKRIALYSRVFNYIFTFIIIHEYLGPYCPTGITCMTFIQYIDDTIR